MPPLRRSQRLLSSRGTTNNEPYNKQPSDEKITEKIKTTKRRALKPKAVDDATESKTSRRSDRKKTKKTSPSTSSSSTTTTTTNHLPRTREKTLQSSSSSSSSSPLLVMGVDEAGRGPLAGPVVAAAVILPATLPGITDSKKISETDRDRLFHEIITSDGVRWCAAVTCAQRIDEINILAATMEAMSKAVQGVMTMTGEGGGDGTKRTEGEMDIIVAEEVSANRTGCYIVCGGSTTTTAATATNKNATASYHALIDGNRIPPSMPCPSESIVKGDGKEYCIAAASIIAKVTRDRLMTEYDAMYPQYNLKKHKGYPTAAHMALVKEFGASPIHRRTFAPLKHMEFDEEGRVVKK